MSKTANRNKPRLNNALFTSRSDEWETPQYVFRPLHSEFHFQIDVCAISKNAKCEVFFDRKANGLKQDWSPFRCWMNPPYGSDIKNWVEKAYQESQRGALVVCLLPARTDTQWWHNWVMKAGEVRFVVGRISFGSGKQSAPFPSCVAVFYPEMENPYRMSVPLMRSVKFDKHTGRMKILSSDARQQGFTDGLLF